MNTFLAISRTECCDTLAKTALRSSLKPAEPMRAAPSDNYEPIVIDIIFKVDMITLSDKLTTEQ